MRRISQLFQLVLILSVFISSTVLTEDHPDPGPEKIIIDLTQEE